MPLILVFKHISREEMMEKWKRNFPYPNGPYHIEETPFRNLLETLTSDAGRET